ncbi:MAG: hypothetical protein OEV42_19835 [Deltaproteobacteria bacterium]|nr:hypothetical protein [Deltaproteobacteria bacterium]
MTEEPKLRGITRPFISSVLITVALAVTAASCSSEDRKVANNTGQTPKQMTLEVTGKNAKALTFSNWAFERMNGDNPVFAGKITYNGGMVTKADAFCFQDGMKSIAHLIFNSDLKPGESAKGEIHCAQIRNPPVEIVIELN